MISGGINSGRPTRGSFILLEGVDRCGKTTQCSLLVKHLISLSIAAVAFRFPDRTTSVGEVIDGYLRSGKDIDDHAVHLLFSANRWEVAPQIAQHIANGDTVVCDRYAYSGVAFSSAKREQDLCNHQSNLSIEWCRAPDIGLPAPDAVIFLDLSQEDAERRGGFGEERYENSNLQLRVKKQFAELQKMDEEDKRVHWYVVDAAQSIESVQRNINEVVDSTLQRVSQGAPLRTMFHNSEYVLPKPSFDNI